ncbi:MAG: AraC family transcriptional regulator [Bryobacteraceae bacterium]|nr:AraC family transcriptional regulator [Bryobacteraceae bacterium]
MNVGMFKPAHSGMEEFQRLISDRLLPALERTPANALRGSLAEMAPPDEFTPSAAPTEKHRFVELVFCLAGTAELWIAGAVRSLRDGGLLVIPADMEHSSAAVHAMSRDAAAAFSRLMWVSFHPYGCVINVCESRHGIHESTPRLALVERRVNTCIQGMVLELACHDTYAAVIARCRLIEALALIARGAEIKGSESVLRQLEAPAPTNTASSRVEQARLFIEQNFDAHLSLDAIAQAVCSNKSHLCREFKVSTGHTMIEHLTKVRVDAARRLLLTSLSINQVSELVGFEDPYYFSRVFSRCTGMSPTAYRKEKLGGETA